MSGSEPEAGGGPIAAGSSLARALGDTAPPRLSADFADRVLAAAETRAGASLTPLPPLRRRAARGGSWRMARRFAIGALGVGALASAAAATGLLERLDLPVPSAKTVWASITGSAPAPAPAPRAPAPSAAASAALAPLAPLAPVEIVGPIDTPEELGEAFRRIDEVRQGRREARRDVIDQRITAELERRRAAGLPVPSAEEEARLRQRIEAAQTRRQQRVDARVEAQREELERKIGAGETLTRADIVRPQRQDTGVPDQRDHAERLRRMTPDERRRALRQLPPEERRALIEAWRQRRAQRDAAGAAASPAQPAATASPATAAAPAAQPQE
jgi:hypothetical protein